MSTSASRRRLWIALGAMFIVGGLVAAALLWSGASQRRTSAIENFARAPVGCDTTLDFVEPGEYLLFVETAGTLEEVRGDCDVDGAYESDDEVIPDIEITLVDPDGNEIDLDRSFGDVQYDTAGFRGVALRSIEIEETDDHVLRAESDVDDVVVIAIGRDPADGVAALRIGAITAGLIGLLVGLALVLTGARRSLAVVPAGPWTPGAPNAPGGFVPGGPAPQGPPVFERPSGPPQFGQPPPSGTNQQPESRDEPPPFSWQPPGGPTDPPAPRSSQPPPPAVTPPSETDPAQRREERRTQDRPPPPPPE